MKIKNVLGFEFDKIDSMTAAPLVDSPYKSVIDFSKKGNHPEITRTPERVVEMTSE